MAALIGRIGVDWEGIEYRYMRPVIAVGCAYETVAIVSNRVPTISKLVGRLYNDPRGRVALWVVWGYLTTHLMERVVEQAVEMAVEEAGG